MPDVAEPALRFHRLQHRQMSLPGEQVVHLQQVEAPDPPVGPRILDLAGAARRGPYLVGRKEGCRPADAGETVADDRLGRAVHGRRVDQSATLAKERAHHRGALVAQLGVVADVEGDPAAQSHDRQPLAGGGNRAGDEAGLTEGGEGTEGQRRGGGGHGTNRRTARGVIGHGTFTRLLLREVSAHAGELPQSGRATRTPVARRIAATYSGSVARVTSTTPPESGACSTRSTSAASR